MAHDAELILIAGAMLALGVVASALATRLRLPALILFLGVGMLLGSDALGWIYFDNYRLARLIGTIALVLILFEAGLAVGWEQLRPVLRPALLLATVGTITTALIAGAAATWLFDYSLLEGFLLGAILAATDGAAVFALLRGIRLPLRVSRVLEGEAGFNDPVAVLMVLVLIELILTHGYGVGDMIGFLVREVGIGAVAGCAVGWLASAGAGRAESLPNGVLLVASLATAAIAYGSAGALGGSGFLAVYLAGLFLARARLPQRAALTAFHDGLGSVAEIGMFLTLGLLVFPSQLGGVFVKGVAVALVTAVIARPVATFIATWRTGLKTRERVVIGWAGLRGAVPVILATFPVIRGVPHSVDFFNIVFFAVLLSAAVQGFTVQTLASRLGVTRG